MFPDYKLVTEVERSKQGAAQLWRAAVSPAVGRAGEILGDESPIRSWVLPYSCVILLCKPPLSITHRYPALFVPCSEVDIRY